VSGSGADSGDEEIDLKTVLGEPERKKGTRHHTSNMRNGKERKGLNKSRVHTRKATDESLAPSLGRRMADPE